MTGARRLLGIAVGAIAVIALVWFVSSFFVLEDENPRGALTGPAYAQRLVVDGSTSTV